MVIDREKKREKRETHVIETEKTRREERDNRWTNGWSKGGHKEVTIDTRRKSVQKKKQKKVKGSEKEKTQQQEIQTQTK